MFLVTPSYLIPMFLITNPDLMRQENSESAEDSGRKITAQRDKLEIRSEDIITLTIYSVLIIFLTIYRDIENVFQTVVWRGPAEGPAPRKIICTSKFHYYQIGNCYGAIAGGAHPWHCSSRSTPIPDTWAWSFMGVVETMRYATIIRYHVERKSALIKARWRPKQIPTVILKRSNLNPLSLRIPRRKGPIYLPVHRDRLRFGRVKVLNLAPAVEDSGSNHITIRIYLCGHYTY